VEGAARNITIYLDTLAKDVAGQKGGINEGSWPRLRTSTYLGGVGDGGDYNKFARAAYITDKKLFYDVLAHYLVLNLLALLVQKYKYSRRSWNRRRRRAQGCDRTLHRIPGTKPSQTGSRICLRYSIYLLYWYKSTNTDAEGAARPCIPTGASRWTSAES
jgi:hypothetical protein